MYGNGCAKSRRDVLKKRREGQRSVTLNAENYQLTVLLNN